MRRQMADGGRDGRMVPRRRGLLLGGGQEIGEQLVGRSCAGDLPAGRALGEQPPQPAEQPAYPLGVAGRHAIRERGGQLHRQWSAQADELLAHHRSVGAVLLVRIALEDEYFAAGDARGAAGLDQQHAPAEHLLHRDDR